jgi:serine/threonine protein kinase
VIHRDLKPSNVMLAPDGPRVIDFGIARALEEARAIPGGPADADAVTGAQQVLGSPGFMAPEQLIAGSELGPACDVFCLGLVLCFAAGVAPYGAGPVQALLYRIVHESPDLSGVPEGPRAIVAACLAKDPAARPTSAQILDLIGASDALAPAPTVKMPRSHGSHESYTRVDTHLGPSLSPSLGANLGQNLSPNLDTAARAVPSTAAWPSSAPPTLSAVSAVSPQFSAHQVPAQQPPTQQVPAQQFLPATPHPMPPYRPYSPDNAYILKPRSSGRRIGMLIGIPVAIAALAGVVALVAATAGRDSHSGGPTGGSTAPASTGPTR